MDDKTRTEWWEFCQRLMRDRQLTVDQVAREAGIPRKTLYTYLEGRVANPRGDVLQILAHALGTTEAELRFGKQSGAPAKPLPVLGTHFFMSFSTKHALLASIERGEGKREVLPVPTTAPTGSVGFLVVRRCGRSLGRLPSPSIHV
jgi:transcriptional regulator with XRE-family HTH domain